MQKRRSKEIEKGFAWAHQLTQASPTGTKKICVCEWQTVKVHVVTGNAAGCCSSDGASQHSPTECPFRPDRRAALAGARTPFAPPRVWLVFDSRTSTNTSIDATSRGKITTARTCTGSNLERRAPSRQTTLPEAPAGSGQFALGAAVCDPRGW